MPKTLTVRLSDELHSSARKAAGASSLAAFVREAIAEKVGAAGMQEEVQALRERVEQLERLVGRLDGSGHRG